MGRDQTKTPDVMHRNVRVKCPRCKEEYLRAASSASVEHQCEVSWYLFVNHVRVEMKRLHPDAVLPDNKFAWNCGYDLTSIEDVLIPANSTANIPTGLALSVPLGYFFLNRTSIFSLYKRGNVNWWYYRWNLHWRN